MTEKRKIMIDEFKSNLPLYKLFTKKIESLIKTLIEEAGIKTHSITSRIKEINSLEKKISQKSEKYKKFTDVTDLSGVRIICFSTDQVDNVAKLLKKNFKVLRAPYSVDKRETMDPDRFGYLSLHLIVKISKNRSELPEYSKYKDLLCEIQIRTLLQHTWAEIEHDLGYKSEIAIPKEIKRRFYRLAGLLELADDEFNIVIKNITKYSVEVGKIIETSPKGVLIDIISLKSYVLSSKIIQKIDLEIAKAFEIEFRRDFPDEPMYIDNLKVINFFRINTIDELDKVIRKNAEQIVKFARYWYLEELKEEKDAYQKGFFTSGIAIFYLGYILISSTQDLDKVKDYCKFLQLEDVTSSAKKIIKLYNQVISNKSKN